MRHKKKDNSRESYHVVYKIPGTKDSRNYYFKTQSALLGFRLEPESQASRNLLRNRIVALRIPEGEFYFAITTTDYQVIKFDRNTPSFKFMTAETRGRLIAFIASWGNAPSKLFRRQIGLTARQVGQIRRKHVPGWRVLNARSTNTII